ncbi:MAG: metal-dependent hydrolase, partial [Erythrobacter sp.]
KNHHVANPVNDATMIASPLPLWGPLRRELITGGDGRYAIETTIVSECRLPDFAEARHTNSQLDAFLFWSRAPFATRAPDGSVILYDARFYDPRARDRFSVALPDVKCETLNSPSP